MPWPPIVFFRNNPHILALGSTRAHGNMRISAGTAGNSNRRSFANTYIYPGARLFPVSVAHENRVEIVRSESSRVLYGVDGLITTEEESYLGMPFADCPPILLSGLTFWHKPMVALIHASYKSLLEEVILETIQKMIAEGADFKTVRALIGPSICGKCYIFGPEAPRVFREYGECVKRIAGTVEYLVDLAGIAQIKLERAGIKKDNIFCSRLCTHEAHHLFSARREKMRPKDSRNPLKACMIFLGIRELA